jgi:hypothetical protein
MRTTGDNAQDGLRSFVRGLNREQADLIMSYLPQVIAIIEERAEPSLLKQFLRTG